MNRKFETMIRTAPAFPRVRLSCLSIETYVLLNKTLHNQAKHVNALNKKNGTVNIFTF